MAQTLDFMYQNVAYRTIVYETGVFTIGVWVSLKSQYNLSYTFSTHYFKILLPYL